MSPTYKQSFHTANHIKSYQPTYRVYPSLPLGNRLELFYSNNLPYVINHLLSSLPAHRPGSVLHRTRFSRPLVSFFPLKHTKWLSVKCQIPSLRRCEELSSRDLPLLRGLQHDAHTYSSCRCCIRYVHCCSICAQHRRDGRFRMQQDCNVHATGMCGCCCVCTPPRECNTQHTHNPPSTYVRTYISRFTIPSSFSALHTSPLSPWSEIVKTVTVRNVKEVLDRSSELWYNGMGGDTPRPYVKESREELTRMKRGAVK